MPFVLLIPSSCFAQNDSTTAIQDLTKVTFLSPGISYEKRIGPLQSLTGRAYLSTEFYYFYSSTLGTSSGISFYPAVDLQYRYYYNSINRAAKGKRTEMNSLNYLSGFFTTTFYNEIVSSGGDKTLRASKIIAATWGFQRNYPGRFSLDFHLGPGYFFTRDTDVDDQGQYVTENMGEFTIAVQIALGFWLNKRK